MFDLNKNLKVKKFFYSGSVLYKIENIYKKPDEIVDYICKQKPPLWKYWEGATTNGVFYDDRRHIELLQSHTPVAEFFADLCEQPLLYESTKFVTNQFRMIDKNFNTYESSYWFPHRDVGFNALIYLNPGTHPGTNLYHPDSELDNSLPEHVDPWKPRENLHLMYTSVANYNCGFLFDGKKFPHGMAIGDDRFFTETRLNHAIFFRDPG